MALVEGNENYIHDVYSEIQLRKKISKIKNNLVKNIPKTIGVIELNSEYLKDFVLEKKSIDGNNFIILTTLFLIENALNYSLQQKTIFFCDGTFKSSPLLAKQLWTLHFSFMGYWFPVLFVLSEKRTATMYEYVFNYVKTKNIIIKNLMCDFEKAVESGFRKVFGMESKLKGCLFHFCQAILRKVGKFGLLNEYYKTGSPFRVVKY